MQSKTIAEPTQNIRLCVILFLNFDVGLESWAYALKVCEFASCLGSKISSGQFPIVDRFLHNVHESEMDGSKVGGQLP